jgi:signal transduction histidine kinase
VAISGAMSVLLLGAVAGHTLVIGAVAALICSAAIGRITRRYRRALREANQQLEARVEERTRALREANAALQAQISERRALGEALDDARSAARQICDVCEDLGTLSSGHPEGGGGPSEALEATDIAAVLETARRLASHRLAVPLSGRPPLPPVGLSPARLCQVLLNLLLNAGEAARANGGEVWIEGDAGGGWVRLAVADSGAGMSREALARAFEPLFTSRSGRGGTGLGLPVCRAIVEQAGGRIELESREGVGTRVTLWLPGAAAQATVA